ncbi:Isoform b, partial [Globisporangium splendens]
MFMARSHFHLLLLATAAALLCSDGTHAQVADATPEQLKPKVPTVVSDDAFDRADTDHNGFLDAQEFASFTSSIKKALDPFLSIYSAGEGDDQLLEPRGNDGGFAAPNKARLRGGGVNKFWSGFVSGILTIWATEIGDKTFFIAAILSMKQDRVVVFAGAIGALIVMTVLSVVMGVVATKFLPPHVTHYIGALLFIGFGAKMLYDSREMSATGPSEELSEVEEELMGKKTEEEAKQVEAGQAKPLGAAVSDSMMQVFTQTFLMTFLAEWGDRSQIATVTLSATKDAFGVTLGAILGHSMCTGIAVIGGKFLATRISEKTVTLVGGALFVLFALHSFIVGPPEV